MRAIEMRTHILAAVAAGLAMGCQTSSQPVTATVDKVDPDAAAPGHAEVAPITASPKPKSSACTPDAPEASYCLAPFSQPAANVPPQMLPKLPFDKQGCLARENLNDMCGGVRQVLSGPRFEKGQCCFTVCKGQPAPCGRPFLDDTSRPRVAQSTVRADWQRVIEVESTPIAARLRDEWLEDAAAEHASVAAFARFTMELLAVGAPSSLVEQSQRAGQDEIEHARACYALASAYGAAVRGPDRLSLAGVSLRDDLAEVAVSAVIEGCIGETYAAMCAAEARASCTDLEVGRVLDMVAEDEARHAALAWQFVAWAIETPSVRAAVERAFARGPRRRARARSRRRRRPP